MSRECLLALLDGWSLYGLERASASLEDMYNTEQERVGQFRTASGP